MFRYLLNYTSDNPLLLINMELYQSIIKIN